MRTQTRPFPLTKIEYSPPPHTRIDPNPKKVPSAAGNTVTASIMISRTIFTLMKVEHIHFHSPNHLLKLGHHLGLLIVGYKILANVVLLGK